MFYCPTQAYRISLHKKYPMQIHHSIIEHNNHGSSKWETIKKWRETPNNSAISVC